MGFAYPWGWCGLRGFHIQPDWLCNFRRASRMAAFVQRCAYTRSFRGFIALGSKPVLCRHLREKDMIRKKVLSSFAKMNACSERAEKIGARDIEIVVISSPVIETGNDMDFDYAVLDPSSVRSIIQAAGRVRRHRSAEGGHPNVLILGRSPIAMQDGSLRMPGVETKPADETKVSRRRLDEFEGRLFDALAGDENFARISAAPVISRAGFFPLRDREAELRSEMVSASDNAPLGKYTRHINARLNLAMTRTRRFRRSVSRDILYRLDGDGLDDAAWYLDLNPGTSESVFHEAEGSGLECDRIDAECLFRGSRRLRVEQPDQRSYGDVSAGSEHADARDDPRLWRRHRAGDVIY